MSHGSPYRCVGTIARVLSVISRSTDAGSMLNVVRVDVGENDRQTGDPRELRHDPERERRKDDLRAGGQIQRLQHVVEGDASVGRGDRVRRSQPVPGGERGFELGYLGTLDELAAGLAARDELFGFRKDSRAIARDRCQHATGRAISAISSRACRSLTRRSMRLTHSRIAPFWILRKFARYDGRM